jgi:hypothetical protein
MTMSAETKYRKTNRVSWQSSAVAGPILPIPNPRRKAKEHHMERIVAGRFETKDAADSAAALIAGYVDKSDICIFHNNPPGQHGTSSPGSDEEIDLGAREGEAPAASTALAAGIAAGAIGAVGGPVIALAAAGVAAYTGSLVGALHGLGGGNAASDAPTRRPAGVILAVRVGESGAEQRVISDLQHQGAADIEKANGEWRDGDWTDFNPGAAPQLVQSATN